jgi:hypothetical protein
MNVLTPAIFLTSMLTFLWPFVHGTGALVTVSLLYGVSLGAFVALLCVPLIALGDSTDVGRRTGMFLTILSLCSLAGPPISGAIYHATGRYTAVGIYAGLFPFQSQCATNGIGVDYDSMPLFVFHTRLRIHDDGLCGAPRTLSLLCSEEMEREGIEE